MLDKETWRKDYWFLFFICSLVRFLYTAKCEFSSILRFYIKDLSPSLGSGAPVGLIFPEIFVSPLLEFEQHMYSSDPRTDTGSLMQLESRRAVPQASKPPIIQSLNQDILIIPQLDGREVKDFGITHISFIFLFFDSKPESCQPICGIIIANKSFSSAKAALVRSFRASGKNRRHLGCSIVMRSRGCAVQNKGSNLTSSFFHWKCRSQEIVVKMQRRFWNFLEHSELTFSLID